MDMRKLSIMTFPQRWTNRDEIIANLLLLPSGDPTEPVGTALPPTFGPFSQAQPVLRAKLLRGLGSPPWDGDAYDSERTLIALSSIAW